MKKIAASLLAIFFVLSVGYCSSEEEKATPAPATPEVKEEAKTPAKTPAKAPAKK